MGSDASRRHESHVGEEALGDVLTFMRALWKVDHGLRSVSKRMATALGVTGPQRLVIRVIGRYPSLSAGEIASFLHIDPSTLTGILARLERHGLIVRAADPGDGRRSLFQLAARGREINASRAGTVEQAVRRTLATLPDAKVSAAREVLEALAHELGADE